MVSCFSHTQKLLECRINTRGKVSALYGPAHLKKKNGGNRIGLRRGKKNFSVETRASLFVCVEHTDQVVVYKTKIKTGWVACLFA